MRHSLALRSGLVHVLALCAACDLESCVRGDQEELDCSDREQQFDDTVAREGVLLDAIPDKPSFPMALVITERGIAELLKGITSDTNPVAGGNLTLFGLNLQIVPQKTEVELTSELDKCSRCVIFAVDFSLQAITDGGTSQLAGTGRSKISIPLRLEELEGDTTALVAAYEQMTILDLTLTTMGFITAQYPEFEKALEIKMTQLIREQSEPVQLMKFEPWTIGTNSVKVAAKQFAIFPTTGVISLGMQTNLDLPKAVALEVGQALDGDAMMAVQMHPGLLLGMAERMLAEGVIPRRYDDDGNPDPEGPQGITLTGLGKNALGANDLDVTFRVWRTKGDYCGYANAVSVLRLGLDDSDGIQDRITVTPTDDLQVLEGGVGVGELYEDNKELVEENKGLVDSFKRSLADQIGITVNYNELAVDGQNIVFDATGLEVTDKKIDILLDFLVLAAEGG
ncbi:hypothetical protein [Nannocystis punicea]|uniref:Uncharacterized protein n=1 Tax=Nannocystis punicea TaxID=2995304 RepID=A0ABY7H0U1_9BACT|nr:hypothetical protein [Nannocystis poenicansa]WAS92762.1 hypothetical protein O0S08_41840 [Nannocystis poenicansa]